MMKSVVHDLSAHYPLPPRSAARSFLGDMRKAQADPLGFLLKLGLEHNGFARFHAGLWDVYLVAHPGPIEEMLRDHYASYSKRTFTYNMIRSVSGEGLLTLDGEEWHERRRLLQPIFSKEQVARLDQVVTSATLEMLDAWEQAAQIGTHIDLIEEINRLTLTIATQAFFGINLRESQVLRNAVNDLSVAYAERIRSKWFALWALLGRFSPTNQRAISARKLLDRITRQIIHELRSQSPSEDNLLTQLATAQHADSGKQLSESELQAEVSTLLLAGHETTARALSWCLYLLSQHAEIAHKAAFEANQALADRTPTFGDIGNLEYTHWVVQEALRLYPSVYAFSRRAERDDTVCGYRVPKGTKILVSPFVLHRLPDIWPNPDEFQPERFSPEQSNTRSPHAYIPFGAGPRQCIGRRFAMLEMRLIVPMILQRFQLECTSPIPVLPAALGTLTPQSPIHFRLTHRFSAYN